MQLTKKFIAGAATVAFAAAATAGLPPRQNVTTQVFATGFSRPVEFVQHPTNPNVQFVVEQSGRIRVIQNGVVGGDLINILGTIGAVSDERGLLGLAFPANYPTDPRFYVNYTNWTGTPRTVIERWTHMPGNDLQGDPSMRQVILTINQPFTNHNGGHIDFGPDGMLYIGMGDGGLGGDPLGSGQNINTLLGAILRIDVSGAGGYTNPPDNPFVGVAGADEIWAIGVRNPWKFTFDMGQCSTGALLIADVGQDAREEVNYAAANTPGLNYGWDCREGTLPFEGCSAPPGLPFVNPILDYSHALGFSITGGYVYRGAAMPLNRGRYFYGDFGTGRVWSTDVSAGTSVDNFLHVDFPFNVSSFGRDAAGELYVLNYGSGQILKLVPTGDYTPGDLDGDGDVDGADLAILLGQWNSMDCGPADITNDGIVGGADLAVQLGNWGG